jgi:hypothetical protein
MTDLNNLKPCPLCGSVEKLLVYMEYLSTPKREMGVVECTQDGCPMIIREVSIEKAVKKWNRRPIEEFLEEENNILSEKLALLETELAKLKE